MKIYKQTAAELKCAELFEELARRKAASAQGVCPVDSLAAFVELCLSQSCGKCVPCRVGLSKLHALLEKVLDQKASSADLDEIEALAQSIYDSADCAIGFEAAKLVIDGLASFRDDFVSHIEKGVCTEKFASVPCESACPAHVDIPGYIALIGAGRYADAVRVIRNNNPFPAVCGLICEHPCEEFCRRRIVDDAINIRGLKRYAVEKAGVVPAPAALPSKGKTVAVIGGGPSGLTAAYYLQLMGYEVTVFEAHKKLGGMLRYGIPVYRLPDKDLDGDIDMILSTGVKVRLNTGVGKDITLEELRAQYDAVYISIGAQADNKLRIPGEDAEGVMSAVELLGRVGEGERPDFSGKNVIIVGGGNVAMDATRTSRRLGAKSVKCVYRRRIADMTALPDEIEGAIGEGCEVMELLAPLEVATKDGKVTGLVVQPQLSGPVEGGRPKPIPANKEPICIEGDIIVVAVGQAIDSAHFENSGVAVNRKRIAANSAAEIPGMPGVFAGGDCYSGPATAIKAIDCGRVAAVNIDAYFGNNSEVAEKIEISEIQGLAKSAWGRVKLGERDAASRAEDFGLMELCMTEEEALSECARCLRCDHFGHGNCKGGCR